MAEKFKIPSYKISAKTGEGVNEFFIKLIDHINEFQRR